MLAIRKYKEKVSKVLRRYNIPPVTLMHFLDIQQGCCAICSKDFGETSYHIDHCHTDGSVRGLLCSNCNTGIGLLQEDETIFNNAIQYLRERQ